MKLQGKVALVTGAGSGIGKAICHVFAQNGASIIAVDLDAKAAAETANEVRGYGVPAESLRADVRNATDAEQAVEATKKQFGTIHILANVAGIGSTQNTVDTSLNTWEEVFAVNARGTFLMSKYTLPIMIAQGGGNIINMGSVAGLVGLPNRAAYSAAKGAVLSLTRAMAIDHVAQGIRVNAICPGTVDSPWVGRLLAQAEDPAKAREDLIQRQPMGRLGTPQEIAYAALYLASDESAFVTGVLFTIDGGLTAR